MSRAPVSAAHSATLARLGERLRELDYSESGLERALSVDRLTSVSETRALRLLNRARQEGHLDALIRLFFLGLATDADRVRAAVAPVDLEALAEIGWLEIAGETVEPEIKLTPIGDLVLAHDERGLGRERMRSDHVLGLGTAPRWLAELTVRRPCDTVLDLGTGCGIQAFLASPHSDLVFAVDVNDRAVELARLNAGLNGIDNVRVLQGDFFSPVEGERFDLIVCNPPYVVSPESTFLFRDSELRGDELCRDIARRAPDFLAEGGFFQMLATWVSEPDETWEERVESWFEGCDCDVWVAQGDSAEPDAYAARWVAQSESGERDDLAQRVGEWCRYYEEEGIEAIGSGLVTIRYPAAGDGWRRFDELPDRLEGPCGDSIVRGFAARDYLEGLTGAEQLLDEVLEVAPELRIRREMEVENGGWSAPATELALTRGLGYTSTVDNSVASLVAGCDGSRALRDVLQELARAADRDLDAIVDSSLAVIRQLITYGFLIPKPVAAELARWSAPSRASAREAS